ncbi:MAG: glycosyltransferase, partial [Thermoplasmatota archaeon]
GHDETEEMAQLIVALLDHPALREEMGRNGAREAQRFTWDACARKTLEVYHSVTRSTPAVLALATPQIPAEVAA